MAAYTEALRVRTIDDFPVHYTMIMANVGEVYFMKGNTAEAHKVFDEAVRIFERESLKEHADRVKSRLDRLKQKI